MAISRLSHSPLLHKCPSKTGEQRQKKNPNIEQCHLATPRQNRDKVEDKQATRPGRMRMLRRTPAQPPAPVHIATRTCPLRPNRRRLSSCSLAYTKAQAEKLSARDTSTTAPPPPSRLVQLSAPSHTRAAPFSRVKSVPAFLICPLSLSSFFRRG
ncbi:hypothetical protein HDV57DRAFT_498047 [Trichoderma longibrachiatum]|uniref:Uncharacterized protein n=1 Tax=Trichoderma longibrachiatum ATCC 18648 TaxID=983965 RepID=A0A2T4BT49_TRILO|nr:hypothetical protein M440DRAFT_158482 [Trichoderma longibrachiatum ATCC 18648]